jgi:hypothetical protein
MSLIVPFKKEFQEMEWAAAKFNQTQRRTEVFIAALAEEPGIPVERGKLRIRYRVIAKAIAEHASPKGRISLSPEESVRSDEVFPGNIRRWTENYQELEGLVGYDRFMLFPCPIKRGGRLLPDRNRSIAIWNETYRAWLDLLERGINLPDEINTILVPNTDVPRPERPKVTYQVLTQTPRLIVRWSIDGNREGIVYDLDPGLSEEEIMDTATQDALNRAGRSRILITSVLDPGIGKSV